MAETPLSLAGKAAGVLAERGIEQPRLDAELLLAHILGLRRLDLYLQHERPITRDELERFRAAVRRRLRREPIQYIIGTAGFRMLELQVDRRALIPRPETEVLVGAVLEWSASRGEACTALDIGTGTGAIVLSLAAEGKFERLLATDASTAALELARANALRTGLDARVEFRHGVTWTPISAGERFDVIVSNPPYVAEPERAEMAPEVVEWEPADALFAGGDGMAVIEPLVAGAAERLQPGGLLALEVGAAQTEQVAARIRATGSFAEPRILTDLAGRPRVVLAALMEGEAT